MGRILTVTNSNSFTVGERKKTIKREIIIGPAAIKFIAIGIFSILSIVYLAQSTAGANRSIKVRGIEDSKAKLELEQERLQVEQTRLKSLKEIDSGVEKNPLEPVSSVDHIENDVMAVANTN